MIRRIIRKTTCLLVLILCLGAITGCAKESGTDEVTEQEEVKKSSPSIGQHCSDLIRLLSEKVHSDTYVELMTTSSLTKSDAFAKLREGNYDAPEKIYKITFTKKDMKLLCELANVDQDAFDNMSKELKEAMQGQMFASYMTVLTSKTAGAERLALQSLFTAQKLFVAEEKNLSCIYLYAYKDAYPVAIYVGGAEDGATQASASFVLIDDFKADTEEDVISSMFISLANNYVDLVKLFGVEVKEISD